MAATFTAIPLKPSLAKAYYSDVLRASLGESRIKAAHALTQLLATPGAVPSWYHENERKRMENIQNLACIAWLGLK